MSNDRDAQIPTDDESPNPFLLAQLAGPAEQAHIDAIRIARDNQRRAYRSLTVLRNQEAATWLGLLIDLAEAGESVTVHVASGLFGPDPLQIHGVIHGVGLDVISVSSIDHAEWVIVTGAISAIVTRSSFAANGDRELGSDATSLPSVMRRAADDQASATVYANSLVSQGRVRTCGIDLVSIEAPTGHLTHIRVSNIAAIRF